MNAPVLLTVRGTLVPKTYDAARTLHNETAGSAQGMEAARSLTDISHCVFLPSKDGGKLSQAKQGELLFIDFWADPKGLMNFFSNAHVQEQAGKMFSSKDASVWMPATGAFTFRVPPTSGKLPRVLGLFRAPVKSPEAAIAAFTEVGQKNLAAARRRGLLSHELFVRMGQPGEAPEVLGFDTWAELEGMKEHYGNPGELAGLGVALAGDPAPSVWEQATGFNEW